MDELVCEEDEDNEEHQKEENALILKEEYIAWMSA